MPPHRNSRGEARGAPVGGTPDSDLLTNADGPVPLHSDRRAVLRRQDWISSESDFTPNCRVRVESARTGSPPDSGPTGGLVPVPIPIPIPLPPLRLPTPTQKSPPPPPGDCPGSRKPSPLQAPPPTSAAGEGVASRAAAAAHRQGLEEIAGRGRVKGHRQARCRSWSRLCPRRRRLRAPSPPGRAPARAGSSRRS
jgi:hypothetical protein